MIRCAEITDLELIVQLCAEHADYERADYQPGGKRLLLHEALFVRDPKLYCLIAEADGEPVGYATYMVQFSTWEAGPYLYMDCLYLREGARGKGLGQEMMEAVMAEGRRLGCGQVQWQTPDFNAGAIRFYQRLGAVAKSKERFTISLH